MVDEFKLKGPGLDNCTVISRRKKNYQQGRGEAGASGGGLLGRDAGGPVGWRCDEGLDRGDDALGDRGVLETPDELLDAAQADGAGADVDLSGLRVQSDEVGLL